LRSRHLAGIGLAAALLSAPRAGWSAPADKGDDLVSRGVKLRRAGDDQGALPLFQKAYETTHAPRAAAQLGFCEQALGQWTDAETHVTEALKAGDDAWVRSNRATLESSLVVIKSHIGRIEIAGDPVGAQVLVNGIVVGALPLPEPVRIPAGQVEIELRAPGYGRAVRSVRVDGGQFQKVALRAERQAPPVAATPAAKPPAPAAVASPPPVASLPPTVASSPTVTVASAAASSDTAAGTPSSEGPGSAPSVSASGGSAEAAPGWRAPVKWVSLGLGAAALGVGVYGILHNRSLVDQFDGGCGIDPVTGEARAPSGSLMTNAGCADLKRSYESASTLGLAGLIGAGVFGAAGVILWITEPSSPALRAALSGCGAAPAPGAGLSVGCRLRF
jgi:hypothetical protein